MMPYLSSQMGATTPEEIFASQFEVYRNQLLTKYTEKSKLIADRETARFKYLTFWRSSLEEKFREVEDYLFNSTELFALANRMRTQLLHKVPMSNLEGYTVEGYAISSNFPFGYAPPSTIPYTTWKTGSSTMRSTFISMFSPITKILEPIADGAQPYYKARASIANADPQSQANAFMYDYRLNMTTMNVLGGNNFTLEQKQGLIDTYNQLGMTALAAEGRELLIDLIRKTQKVMQFQIEIDALELQVTDFMDTSTNFDIDLGFSASQLFAELLALSKTPQAQSLATPMVPPINSSLVSPTDPVAPLPVLVPGDEKKKMSPWLIAGGIAAAIFALKG